MPHRVLFVALSAALLVLHITPWSAGPAAAPVFGWLPQDLAYALLWIAAAALVVLYMSSRAIWPEGPDDPEASP